MKYTENYSLYKPDENDFYDVKKSNDNWDTVDEELSKRPMDTGDASNMKATFTQVSNLVNMTSGEKLSVSFGKIAKAITSLISHLGNTSNPHSITKVQIELGNVDNTSDENKPVSTAQATAIEDAKKAGTTAQTNLKTHTDNKSNPHSVTKAQVGLGNVPNVATNDQAPTYTVATENTALTSGEKLSVAMGKIAKAINSLISHLSSTSNPHGVTKSQVGLGNVENKSSSTIRGELTKTNVTNALGYTPINSAVKGVANGVAELDANGVVPSSQLPSYVDDVLEYSSKSAFPTSGESGKIYVAQDTNLTYRWSGSAYTEISSSLALGTTSSTAYRGDRGNTAYTHSQKTSGNPHGVTKSDVGLGNVDNTADADKSVKYATSAESATKATQDAGGNVIASTYTKIKDIVDNLTSTSTNSPLSANQGKVLKDKIKDIVSAIGISNSDMETYDSQTNFLNLAIEIPSGQSAKRALRTAQTDELINVSGYITYPSGGSSGQIAGHLMIDNTYVYANNQHTANQTSLPITGIYRLAKGQTLYLQGYQLSGQTKWASYHLGLTHIDISNL